MRNPEKPGKESLDREVERLLKQLHPAVSERATPDPAKGPSMLPVTPVAGRRPHNDPFPPAKNRKVIGAQDAPTEQAENGRSRDVENLPPTPLGVWARVVLCAALTVAMTQWPYAACGFSLATYLLGVAMIGIAGVWAARAAWVMGMGRAHVVAIALLFVAAALAASQIMPRFGYAPTPVTWRCSG